MRNGAGGGCVIGADFSRTCEGCEHVLTEPGGKGKEVFRCFAEGPRKGYTVGFDRFLPYIPAWCPKMEREAEAMKKKTTFPDWTGPAYMIVSSGGKDGKRPACKPYQKTEQDLLSLRVTVEIAGGLPVLFSRHMSREAVEAERLEEDRRAAWTNALEFAKRLWKDGTHREFVVAFRPGNPNVGPEAVCIYRRFPQIPAGKAV